MSTVTQIFDDRSTAFIYTGFWFKAGTWIASNGESGTLSSTNDPNASVIFTFPVAAIALRYYGMQRSKGGLYEICVDCAPFDPSVETIDGVDPVDDSTQPPTLLFTRNFSSAAKHVIAIHNQVDPRGSPTGNSQLTLDRFEVDVPVLNPNATTSVQTSTNAVTPATPVVHSGSSAHPLVDTSSKHLPLPAIIGGALGSATVTVVLIFLLCLKKKKLRLIFPVIGRPRRSEVGNLEPDSIVRNYWLAVESSEKDGSLHPDMSSSKPTYGSYSSDPTANNLGGGSSSHPAPAPPPPPQQPMSPTPLSETHSNVDFRALVPRTRRRALDAGPVPENFSDDDDDATLPPEYGQYSIESPP